MQPMPIDVVSVQSQVVYGRVGNSVAVPTLQAHGLNVAAVPTVLLSNTPHYPTLHGGEIPLEWFSGYLSDLSARHALQRTRAILVGYLGSPAQAQVLARWIESIQAETPELRVIVDPVIGDHDHGVYVDPGMIEAYQRHLLPLAHGLLPNGFELERLTGHPVNNVETVITAARTLLTERTQWVAVTSAAPGAWAPGEMQVAIVTRSDVQLVKHPRISAEVKGTGDLFGAVLTARMLAGDTVADAAVHACNRVVDALGHTYRARCAELLLSPTESLPTPG
ncbi:Pyridoxine kinase [compost metagenome]